MKTLKVVASKSFGLSYRQKVGVRAPGCSLSYWPGWNLYAGSKYQQDIEDLSSREHNKM